MNNPKRLGCDECKNDSDFSTLDPDGPCQGCRRAGYLINWTPMAATEPTLPTQGDAK